MHIIYLDVTGIESGFEPPFSQMSSMEMSGCKIGPQSLLTCEVWVSGWECVCVWDGEEYVDVWVLVCMWE